MHPPVPKSEGGIAGIMEKWREQYNFMRNYQEGWKLPDPFLKAAMRSIMVGAAREYWEQLEDKKLDPEELVDRAFEYASRKRLDVKKLDPDYMDVSAVQPQESTNYPAQNYNLNASWGTSNYSSDQSSIMEVIGKFVDEISAIGKGKGKGKGNWNYKGKGKGKGA